MAIAKVFLANPQTGETRIAPIGFSWTTSFFGYLPAIFRTDWKWTIIMFVLSFVTFGLSYFVFPFIYNKLYINDLLDKGFRIKSIEGADIRTIEMKINRDLRMFKYESYN